MNRCTSRPSTDIVENIVTLRLLLLLLLFSLHIWYSHLLELLITHLWRIISWLLLRLNTIWSIWTYLTTTTWTIQYFYGPISEGRQNTFRIRILMFLSLYLSFSMIHVWQTVAVSNNHAVVVAQHVSVVYVGLLWLLRILCLSKHLCRRTNILRRYTPLLRTTIFARPRSLSLFNLKMTSASRTTNLSIVKLPICAPGLPIWCKNMTIIYDPCIYWSNMTMTILLLLLWSWSRPVIWWWNYSTLVVLFFLATSKLILYDLHTIITLVDFTVSSWFCTPHAWIFLFL